jgi:Na+/melibiose symporter-like transporter
MQSISLTDISLFGLFRSLKENIRDLARTEVALAKKEMVDKLSSYRSHAITLAIGGAIAYGGFIVFLAALGFLIAWGLQRAGLEPTLARSIGLGAIGLLVAFVGAIMVLVASKGFSKESLTPKKTLETIRHLKGTERTAFSDRLAKAKATAKAQTSKSNRSSEEMRREVIAMEDRIGWTLEEIAYRASPARMTRRANEEIQAHPYRSSLLALGSGLLSSFILRRRFRG